MEKINILVSLVGCDAETNLETQASPSELHFLNKLKETINGKSEYKCMPTMRVEELYGSENT